MTHYQVDPKHTYTLARVLNEILFIILDETKAQNHIIFKAKYLNITSPKRLVAAPFWQEIGFNTIPKMLRVQRQYKEIQTKMKDFRMNEHDTRSNISQEISVVSRYMTNHGNEH